MSYLSVEKHFQDPCDFPDGKVPVECYDEERDMWNNRTAMSIDKISFKRMSRTSIENVLT